MPRERMGLRILGVDPERRFSGGETQVLGLTRGLIRAGHVAELACNPQGELGRRGVREGIRCHPLPIRNAVDFAAGLRLRALVRRERFDVVHFHTSRAHSLAPFIRRTTSALVVTRRMDYVPNRLFAPWLYNRAVDAVAAISAPVAQALERAGVARSHITIIPSGVDCERFAPPTDEQRQAARQRLGLKSDELAVGAVGALESRKGHRYLIEALARLDEPGPSVRLYIAGSGSMAAELGGLAAMAPGGPARLLGELQEPRDLLWALDIFVQPSLMEGLGVAALEAMACGCPIIASSVGGLRQIITDQESGLLSPAADAGALAAALQRLRADPGLRAALGEAARARVAASFGLDSMARATLELYFGILAKRNRRCGV